jgi:hypothetical protein
MATRQPSLLNLRDNAAPKPGPTPAIIVLSDIQQLNAGLSSVQLAHRARKSNQHSTVALLSSCLMGNSFPFPIEKFKQYAQINIPRP